MNIMSPLEGPKPLQVRSRKFEASRTGIRSNFSTVGSPCPYQQQKSSKPREVPSSFRATRRSMMTSMVVAGLVVVPCPPPSLARDWVGEAQFALGLANPPSPVRFPRPTLDTKFAVLLMRSGYAAVDALNFTPMEDFQVDFWKFRAAEQEGYKSLYDPLAPKVGDLSDPIYFDFISFSQVGAAMRTMRSGATLTDFEEVCEDTDVCEEGQHTVVHRPKAFQDDASLPGGWKIVTADNVYRGLHEGFRGETFDGVPEPFAAKAAPTAEELARVRRGVEAILAVFKKKGFFIRAECGDVLVDAKDPSIITFTVSSEGAANLWGLQALQRRALPAYNVYDALAILGWLRASGASGDFELEIKPDGTGYVTKWSIR